MTEHLITGLEEPVEGKGFSQTIIEVSVDTFIGTHFGRHDVLVLVIAGITWRQHPDQIIAVD